jgi:DNA-binding GntR family transcriptional regulator
VLTVAEARADLGAEHRTISERLRAGDTEEALAMLKLHFDDAIVTLTSREDRGDAVRADGS